MSFYDETNIGGKPLDERQSIMLSRCIGLLSAFFHAEGKGIGLPLEIMKIGTNYYCELEELLPHYHIPTKELIKQIQREKLQNRWVLIKLLRLRGINEDWPLDLERAVGALIIARNKRLAEGKVIL
jgi:hypothetical protein